MFKNGLILLCLGLMLWTSASCRSADPETCTAALKSPVLDPAQRKLDMENFCASRVPLMPAPESVTDWEAFIKKARQQTLDSVVFRGQAAQWKSLPTRVEWLEVIDAGDYLIRKLRYEVVPGMTICGLLYEPKNLVGKVPVVLNVNGHDAQGKSADYKQIRCINQVRRGMLALNLEWFNMGQLRSDSMTHYRMNQLDLCGTSGVSCFYLSMSRAIDLLLEHKHADPDRVAVAGLSGGGWQTIFISSLDERVTLCDPVAGYSSFRTRARVYSDLGDSEQTPTDLATTADYAVLTAMRAPRPTLLTFNDRDNCCFAAGHALPELLEAARPAFRLYKADDNLTIHINHIPGTHNFEQDNREALYRMLGRHFYPDQPFDAAEIACEKEVRTAEELNVALPEKNAGFTELAKELARDLPKIPDGQSDDALRTRLSEVLRYKPMTATAELISSTTRDEVDIHHWKFRTGDVWTVPGVEFIPPKPTRTVLLLGDSGRRDLGTEVASLVNSGARVLAIDPLHVGESVMPTHDFLFGLLISAVGERPLGVQTSQIHAVAHWWNTRCDTPIELRTIGRRTSLMGLCAAALERDAIRSITTQACLGSLKEVIDLGLSIPDGAELFCFGLLEVIDIPQLQKLSGISVKQP